VDLDGAQVLDLPILSPQPEEPGAAYVIIAPPESKPSK
jgi:hypothetical protein